MIHPTQFKFGLKAYGIDISEDEMCSLLKYFDTGRCGMLSVNEMFHAMRSNSINARREACVEAAYNKLDRNRNQCVTISDLEANYDCVVNPQYQDGSKSATQLLDEFKQVWDTSKLDAVVSLAEFLDYYKDVSPGIMSDDTFENMLRNTWNC